MSEERKTIIEKLAYSLDVNYKDLSFLSSNSNLDLEKLFALIQNAILVEQGPIWKKLSNISKLFPSMVNAKIAQDVLGPQITANFSYHVPLQEAVKTAKHFKIKFLIQVIEHLVPSRISELVKSFPIDYKKKVLREMISQKKFYLMANFIDIIELDVIIKLSNEIKNEEDLLKIAKYSENHDKLAQILSKFSDDKVTRLFKIVYDLKENEILKKIIEKSTQDEKLRYANLVKDTKMQKIFKV